MTAPNSTRDRAVAYAVAFRDAGLPPYAVHIKGRDITVKLQPDAEPAVDEVDACDRAFGTTRGKG